MVNNIIKNLEHIKLRIRNACEMSERDPREVKLLLATKTVPVEIIQLALAAGETIIGENKVQELALKYDRLSHIPHESHFIGHLQTNKIKQVIKYANCIQSLDRIELAQKLDHQLQLQGKSLQILIQVNTSKELSKFGVSADSALELIKVVSKYDTLKIQGLMTIGELSLDPAKIRSCFVVLKTLQSQVNQLGLDKVFLSDLSMGMSHDLELAIAEGATILRVGSAIFGKRN